MKFDLTRPCDDCPFRNGIQRYLRPERILEIVMALEQKTFACHKTVYAPQPREPNGQFGKKIRQHCGGALVVMAKGGHFGAMQQVAARLGWFDPEKLDLNAPVFANLVEMLRASEINPEEHDCYWLRESQRGQNGKSAVENDRLHRVVRGQGAQVAQKVPRSPDARAKGRGSRSVSRQAVRRVPNRRD
jgi:hypothetical protein